MRKKIKAKNVEMTHHPFSPSTLAALERCPGRANLCQSVPDIEPGEAAQEGTLLHSAMAMIAMDPMLPWDKGLSKEQIELVDVCENFLVGIFLSCGGASYHVEKKLSLVGGDGKEITNGTPDIYILDEAHAKAYLIDYKFGWAEIEETPDNLQMAAYAAMIWQNHPSVETVEAFLLQPRTNSKSSHVFISEQILNAIGQIFTIVKRASAPDAPLVPGKMQCRYCKAATVCPKLHGEALDIAALSLPAVSRPSDIEALAAKMPELIERVELFEPLCEKIWDTATWLIGQGYAIPGWKLNPGNKVRKVVDLNALYNIMADGGVSTEEFLGICTAKIGQCEAMYADKLAAKDPGITKQAALAAFSDAILSKGAVVLEEQKEKMVRDKKKIKGG